MVIAIDYDATWSADPPLWQVFSRMLKDRGHRLVLITNRSDTAINRHEVGTSVGGFVESVIFAGEMPKREAAKFYNLDVAIWIDDNPATVDSGLKSLWRPRATQPLFRSH